LDRFAAEAEREAEWFGKRQGSLKEAIASAAKSEWPSGHEQRLGRLVVHDHQRRIGRRRLNRLAETLAKEASAIGAVKNFPALLEVVKSAATRVGGIGPLTCYDVARRIGSYRGIAPEVVYLHAGARVGARALGLAVAHGHISVSALPSPLNRLKPAQAENMLCIFKDDLKTLVS
jgi:hypothetical protein